MTHTQTQGADGAGTKADGRREMAAGCCSAVYPCSHQQRDPYSLCAICQKANGLTDQVMARTPAPAATPGVPDSLREAFAAATDSPVFVHDFADPAVSSAPGCQDVSLSFVTPDHITAAFMGNGLAGTIDQARKDAVALAAAWNHVRALIAAQPAGQAGDAGAERLAYETDRDGAWTWLVWAISPAGAHLAAIAHSEAKAEGYRDATARLYPGARVHVERAPVDHTFGASDLRSVAYRAAMKDARRQGKPGFCDRTVLAPNSTRTGAAETEQAAEHAHFLDLAASRLRADGHPHNASSCSNAAGYLRALAARPEAPSDAGWRERVRHVKRGTEYEVLGEAEAQIATQDYQSAKVCGEGRRILREGEKLTVYCGSDGKLWCRFTDEFRDGRFETITPPSDPAPSGQAEG